MSNGYLVAAGNDLPAAREIAEGFGLDVIDVASINDIDTASTGLAAAANLGVVISSATAQDELFAALLQALAARRQNAQLILVTPDARAALTFLPPTWPAMSLDEARSRSSELLRRRQGEHGGEPPRAAPLPPPEPPPPAAEPAPEPAPEPSPVQQQEDQPQIQEEAHVAAGPAEDAPADDVQTVETEAKSAAPPQEESAAEADADIEPPPPAPAPEPPAPPAQALPEPPPSVSAPEAPPEPPPSAAAPEPVEPPPSLSEPEPQPAAPRQRHDDRTMVGGAAPSERSFGDAVDMHSSTRSSAPPSSLGETAPADATAFAPKKLRRGTPELVRIVIHQPKDLNEVIKAAKKIDPSTDPAPQGMPIGNVAIGSTIGVSLDVRGATTDGAIQRRTWTGDPADFNFSVEADESAKQSVFLARVFINDAQIGVLAFTRKNSGPAKKAHSAGDRVRLKRHKRVFLSYSSADRETVAQIATAYQMAGVEHFWDRASLKSGEEWHPRLRREIDRADLFHLCWSKAASDSEWVKKETEHALTRRRKNSGKPEITVQMLDGPPWAPHPPEFDSINFDDFVRAAIVGYARGDGL